MISETNKNLLLLVLLAGAATAPALVSSETYPELEARLQPTVSTLESTTQSYAHGSLSSPSTPWCGGAPTVWVVGGRYSWSTDERPLCQNVVDGTWAPATLDVKLARQDTDNFVGKNSEGGKRNWANWIEIDRSECVTMNVDPSVATADIICGASTSLYPAGLSGYGDQYLGFNEIYLTKADGSIEKVEKHGLLKYPYMNSKTVTTLRTVTGSDADLVFITSDGIPREDGYKNQHRMYKLNGLITSPGGSNNDYFTEVDGPWNDEYFTVTGKPLVADLNGDGKDDMIVFNDDKTRIYIQGTADAWTEVDLSSFETAKYWKSAKLANFNNDNIKDLVVTWSHDKHDFVHVFAGQNTAPYFNVRRPIFSTRIDSEGYDIEVVDADKDTYPDLYVVQRPTEGCPMPDEDSEYDLEPPLDHHRDILFLGSAPPLDVNAKLSFTKLKMDHKIRGCTGMVRQFDDSSLVLSGGSGNHAGYQYLLEW